MKHLKLIFACLLTAIFSIGQVWAAEQVAYTLTPAAGSNSTYNASCDVAISGITWNVTGNAQMIPWRLGGKSSNCTNADREVYSKTAMSDAITKVELTVGAASSITVNSLTLIVASDADFNTQIDAVAGTFAANSTITFQPTSPLTEWTATDGVYFKFVFNLSVSGTSNKFVAFSEAKFYKESSDVIVKTLKSIAVAGMTTSYEVGDVFSFDGTCTATYSVTKNDVPQDDEEEVVTPTSVSSPDMSATGVETVTVSYTEDEVTKTTTYDITISEALPKITIDGTATGITTTDETQSVSAGVGTFGGTFKQYSTTALWFTSGTGYIYNKASFGKIRKITINYKSGGAAAAYQWIKLGDAVMDSYEAASTNGVKYETSTGGSSNTFVVTGDYEYFCLSVSNKNLQATSIVISYEVDAAAPAVTVDPALVDLDTPDAVTDGLIEVTYTNITLADVTVARYNNAACTEAFTGDWLTASLNGDKDIEYTVSENTGDARTAYIKLTAPAADGTSPDVIKIIQVSQARAVPTYTSLSDLFNDAVAADAIVKIVFDDAVITGKKGDNTAYLTDKNNTYGLVIFTSDHGFNVGDVLKGTVQTTLCKYQGNSELKGLTSTTEGLTVSAGSPISTPRVVGDPTTLTGANTGSVIKVTGSCTKETKTEKDYYYIDGVQLYDGLASGYTTPTVDDQYHCTGVFVMFNTIKEIMPRDASELEHIDVPTAVITFNDFSIEKGQNVTLSATVSPAVAASAEVSYSIVDGGEYVSLADAVLTANEIGTAHVLATVADDLPNYSGATKQITVTVTAVDGRYTAVIEGFSAISGKLVTETAGTHKDKEYISFEAKKGNASNAPIIPSGKSFVRIYQNGGYLAVNAVKGCLIDEVRVDIPSTCNSTTIAVGTDEENLPTTGGTAASAGNTFTTGTGLNSQNVYLVCLGTTSSTRLEVDAITVKYTGDPVSVSSIAVGGTYQTEFEKNAIFNHTGVVVTATYSDASTADVTALAEFTDPDMSETGVKTITVSYGGQTTTYTIEVVDATVTGISLSGTYPTQFAQGAEFSHAGMIVTATYSDASEVVVTGESTFTGYDMSGAGVQTVTVAYGGKEATYSIIVVPANTDIITVAGIGLEGTGYQDWSNKTFSTDAKYAGNSYANNTEAIQIRTSGSKEGIVVTTQNGTKVVKSVVVSFQTAPSGTRKLQVYGKSTAYSSAADLFDAETQGTLIGELAADGTVDCSTANYEFIGIRSNDGAMYLASVMVVWGDADVTPEPVYTVVRTGLVADRHYTVCLENNITAVKGATFWSLTYKNSTNTEVYLVEEKAPFDAGKPYIFQATSDNDGKLEVVYGDESVGDPIENGALRGTFNDLSASDLNSINVEPAKVYMLFNNELRPIGTNNYLDAHRAYVRYDQLVEGTPNPAPGRRVKAMPMQGEGTQGVENIEASEKPMKMMIDGQLFIIRGEKMYDATGRLVK